MIDFGNLNLGKGNLQIFQSGPPNSTNEWVTWRKPRGCTIAYMFAMSSGAGGGSGFSGVAASDRGGGGGGASGGQVSLIIPLFLLPDILYVITGPGGSGGIGGTGGSGFTSFVSVSPLSATPRNYVLASANTLSTGGTMGSSSGGGNAGVAGGVITTASANFMSLGIFQAFAGQNGASGGAQTGANGTDVTYPATGLLATAGAGGAGAGNSSSSDFTGGVLTSIAKTLISENAPVVSASGSNSGSSSTQGMIKPFFGYGGLGGSSADNGIGGAGGNAGFGAGGGGGGAGTTGGKGGDGGPGIVFIYCW